MSRRDNRRRWRRQAPLLLAALAMTALPTVRALAQATDCPPAAARQVETLSQVSAHVLRRDLVLLEDSRRQERVQGIVERLLAGDNARRVIKAAIVNDADLFIFSSADGTLYVSAGLVDLLAADADLAYALAHEMSHVDACHHAQAFESVRSRQQAVATGAAILTAVLFIATVGAAAAASGPLGTATASSTAITNVGGLLMGQALMVPVRTGQVQLAKPALARSYIEDSGVVFDPALFASLIRARYTGFDEPTERAAHERARKRVEAAGWALPAALSVWAWRLGERASGHLKAWEPAPSGARP
jgi:hypothetical protein